jgi:hypothetical protein
MHRNLDLPDKSTKNCNLPDKCTYIKFGIYLMKYFTNSRPDSLFPLTAVLIVGYSIKTVCRQLKAILYFTHTISICIM